MLRKITAISLFVPLFAYAEVLQSTSVSSSYSGGVVVAAEATSTGESSASADIRATVRSGKGGVWVEITTEKDGVRRTEVRQGDVSPERSVTVSIATSSGAGVPAGEARATRGGNATTSAQRASGALRIWSENLRALLRNFFRQFSR
ncbi:hypothetical protein HY971_04540 [Candidatus Kaiserbacteria bacterium]|nr:hypothetical protein [Candidatus Kaiserbacteria bacterium]